jgi:soluble lytic murein transglycosylase-like protein
MSPKGAMGLMQIMPKTWRRAAQPSYGLGDDPWQPRDNILAGAAYLREMHDRYRLDGRDARRL